MKQSPAQTNEGRKEIQLPHIHVYVLDFTGAINMSEENDNRK
jgi:hypothetical protein